MLEGLRAIQNTWIGKTVLAGIMGLIVISFVIWGIGDIFRGLSGNEVARVGGIAISASAYRQAYQTELQNLQQRARRPITNEEAHQFGVDSQVLSRMISDAVLDDRIQTLGLAMADRQMASAITSDPAFAGAGGGFDRARFNAVIREQGYNEASFVKEQRHVYLRQQLVQALVGDLPVPKAGVEALSRFQSESRSIDALTLTGTAVGASAPPDEAALQRYFDDHKQAFDAPQYRRIVVLGLTPAALAKPEDVPDAEARKLYDEVKDQRFGAPERRTVQQMVFPSESEAAAALTRIKSGTSFADVAKDRKLDDRDIDLGTVTKGQIFDKGVADAAFGLAADGTSDPVKSTFGFVLAHVVSVSPAALKPYDDVAQSLKQDLAVKAASAKIQGLHDRIEDARSSGKPLTEAAKTAGLDTRTIDFVDARGFDKAGKPIEGLADRDAVLRAAFASDVGVDNDTVQGRDGSMTWFEVQAVDPARPKAFSEVRPQVEAAWMSQDAARRLDEKAIEIVKDLNAGKSVDDVALGLGGLPVDHLTAIRRGGTKALSNEVVAQIYDAPVGGAGSAQTPEGGRLVFRVRSSLVPPIDPSAPMATQIADGYRTALSEDALGAYLSRVGAEVGAKVNQEALRNASGASF